MPKPAAVLPSPPTESPLFGWISCFLIGLPVGLDFEVVGRITGIELLFLALVPALAFTYGLSQVTGPVRRLLMLAMLWFLAQLASDIINETEFGNLIRGSARALITTVLILGYFLVVRDDLRRLTAILIGLATGLLVGFFYEPSDYALDMPWKFGYGMSVTMFIIAIATVFWYMRKTHIAVLLCFFGSALNFYAGYRSMAGISFMPGVLIAIPVFAAPRVGRRNNILFVLAGVALVLSAAGITRLYSYAALGGLLGVEEEDKYRSQVGTLGVLLSGRREILVSSQAIIDRPIFGHGSWASNIDYAYMFLDLSGAESGDSASITSDLIPTHSHLFGAWVEGGVLAALFWLYVLVLLARALTTVLNRADLINPLVAFALMNLAWALFFSPYGLTNRALSCVGVVAAVTVLRLAARSTPDRPVAQCPASQMSGQPPVTDIGLPGYAVPVGGDRDTMIPGGPANAITRRNDAGHI
jgi:hypothetical protein